MYVEGDGRGAASVRLFAPVPIDGVKSKITK